MSERKEQLPLDAKLLNLAIIELNISRRNVSMYPDNHPSIKAAIGKAFGHLEELFQIRSQITLSIAKDSLIIDEYSLDKSNPVYNEFARSLYGRGIASVTFIAGITEEEIKLFHKVITMDETLLKEQGGVEKVMSDMGISHMRAGIIDYGAFHFVEGHRSVSQSQAQIWENYIYAFTEGKLLTEADAEEISGIPPDFLAEMVNKTMTGKEDEQTYDRVITSYLKKSSEEKRLKKGALGNLLEFIDGLKPSLKKQFLSSSVKHLSADPVEAAKLAESLSSDQLMQILRDINAQDELVPETLKNLLEKFSKVKVTIPTIDSRVTAGGDSLIDDITLSPEAMQLFREEAKYQGYVTDTYKDELEAIMGAEFERATDSSTEAVLKEYGEVNLDRLIAELQIEFLETNMLSDEEVEYVKDNFIEYISLFLQTGQFDELSFLYEKFHDFLENERYEDLSSTVVDHIRSNEFIEMLLASYRFWGRKNREEVVEFSSKLKEKLAVPLLDSVIEEQNTFLRSFYLSILSGFGPYIHPFVLERFSDPRWYVKRNMIFLLKETGNKTVLKYIKPFCNSKDFRIALEAMKAYLHFDSPEAYRFIRAGLQSKKIEERDQIIKMIGTSKVSRLVPDLLKLLIKKDALGGDFHLKIPIVNALGDIGDPRALKYLLDICKSKSMLYRKSLEELQVAIYMTLHNYPGDSIEPFIELGSRSKSEKILELCGRLQDIGRENE
ncbi:MAG: HEAT repeat domain-containing protein [Nitrospirota bacterium]|nr:MAG: HEAT repeat domain-containing protein [Nitrospirota bacterium]